MRIGWITGRAAAIIKGKFGQVLNIFKILGLGQSWSQNLARFFSFQTNMLFPPNFAKIFVFEAKIEPLQCRATKGAPLSGRPWRLTTPHFKNSAY